MKRAVLTAAMVGGGLLFPTLGAADTIDVPADYPTIQAGIDAAQDGDTVLVAPGTYLETLLINAKAITLESSGGAAQTVIDGGNRRVMLVVWRADAETRIAGFTIAHGHSFLGGGLSCNGGRLRVSDCVIADNPANTNGGAVMCDAGNESEAVVFERCTFERNRASAGVFYVENTPSLTIAQPWLVVPFVVIPPAGSVAVDLSIPPDLPTPVTLLLQELGLNFFTSTGNVSSASELTIQ